MPEQSNNPKRLIFRKYLDGKICYFYFYGDLSNTC